MDLSHPQGGSVNSSIDGDNFSLTYSHIDNANNFIMQEGCGTLLAKVDIHNAYHLIPVHPHNRYLLGMSWDTWLFPSVCARLPSYSISLLKPGTGSSTTTISFTIWKTI